MFALEIFIGVSVTIIGGVFSHQIILLISKKKKDNKEGDRIAVKKPTKEEVKKYGRKC